MNQDEYWANIIPQSRFRHPDKASSLRQVATTVFSWSDCTQAHKQVLKKRVLDLYALIQDELIGETGLNRDGDASDSVGLSTILAKLGLSDVTQACDADLDSEIEDQWLAQHVPIANRIKIALMTVFATAIKTNFKSRLGKILNRYLQNLPLHVRQAERDDLYTIVMIEFFECIKVWDPARHAKLWPLAYQRINGAMRDHIRFVTKSDPTRLYDWVNTAANMYKTVQKNNIFSDQVDAKRDLATILSILSVRDQEIVIAHALHDKPFKQIGQDINLSESQVSRIYKRSIQTVRDHMHAQENYER